MRARSPVAAALVMLACLWLAACSTPGTRVVLLPQADGSASAVVVSTREGDRTLSRPYERATALEGAHQPPTLDQVDPVQLKRANASLFDMMPPPPQRYTVYFVAGGTTLTAASQTSMDQALAAARSRSGGEIVVTGHTDTVGRLERNDELSRVRAEQIRQLFVAKGFPPDRIEAVGRGQRELAVKTPDNVDEPRNRRVTIEVK